MSNEEIVRAAWNTTKTELQPAYDDLVPAYRQFLLNRAEPILRTNYPTGDGALADFDHWLTDYHRREALDGS